MQEFRAQHYFIQITGVSKWDTELIAVSWCVSEAGLDVLLQKITLLSLIWLTFFLKRTEKSKFIQFDHREEVMRGNFGGIYQFVREKEQGIFLIIVYQMRKVGLFLTVSSSCYLQWSIFCSGLKEAKWPMIRETILEKLSIMASPVGRV